MVFHPLSTDDGVFYCFFLKCSPAASKKDRRGSLHVKILMYSVQPRPRRLHQVTGSCDRLPQTLQSCNYRCSEVASYDL